MDNCNLVHVLFDRSAQNPEEDSAMFTLHLRGIVDLLPDNIGSVTTADRNAWSSNFDTFFDSIKAYVSNKVHLSALKFYELGADANADMGPPVQTITKTAAGTSAAQILPPQLALSATFKNPSAGGPGKVGSRWGRIYIPGITVDALDANGRFKNSVCQVVGDAVRYMCTPVNGTTGARLTTWSRKSWTHADPVTIQVDDVPDVIRSRRFSTTNYRYKVNV